MSTKRGITALLVGSYLIALGIAGLNATSGGTEAVYAVVLVVAFVITGWAIVLPWNGAKTHVAADADQDAMAPVPRS